MPDPSVGAVLKSQDFYRLYQRIENPGDIFEVDESTKAIYIGPNSDVAEIQVQYQDPVTNTTTFATVGVNGPFIGRVNALMATFDPVTNQPARILISPQDVVNNEYVVPNSLAATTFNVPAYIDAIIALRDLASIPATRADRTLRLPNVPWFTSNVEEGPDDNDGSTDLIIPIYGRRLVSVAVTGGNEGVQINTLLVNLVPGTLGATPRLINVQHTATIGGAPITQPLNTVYRASDAGHSSQIYSATPTLTGYTLESDAADGILNIGAVPPRSRGFADLLVLQIGAVGSRTGESILEYLDVYIKLSDQE